MEKIGLLVGMHFRPPAKTVLAHLPAGVPVSLIPEPDNPYDSSAVQVLVKIDDIPAEEYPALEEELPLQGWDMELLQETEEIQLGYLAATGGKPLSSRPDLSGNQEILELLTQPDHLAKLDFGPAGEPLVRVTVQDAAA